MLQRYPRLTELNQLGIKNLDNRLIGLDVHEIGAGAVVVLSNGNILQ